MPAGAGGPSVTLDACREDEFIGRDASELDAFPAATAPPPSPGEVAKEEAIVADAEPADSHL